MKSPEEIVLPTVDELHKVIHSKISTLKKGQNIAVKIHMGEKGGIHFLKPSFIAPIIAILKKLGHSPFIIDSPTWYKPSARRTVGEYYKVATEHGYTEGNLDCPIIISDNHVSVDGVEVIKEIHASDFIVSIAHVTGHEDAGLGAACKNIGIGCITKKQKGISHILARPEIPKSINCSCNEVCPPPCPHSLISKDGKNIKVNIDECLGCGICTSTPCKSFLQKNNFNEIIIRNVEKILKNRTTPKGLFVNALVDITQLCDCTQIPSRIICGDIGYIVSDDIYFADFITLKLLEKHICKNTIQELSKDLFDIVSYLPKEIIGNSNVFDHKK